MATLSSLYGGAGVKSIQRGTISVNSVGAGDTASNTATITSVSVDKSVVLPLGVSAATGFPDAGAMTRVALTNGTTVTATVSNTSSGAISFTVGFVVIEFA